MNRRLKHVSLLLLVPFFTHCGASNDSTSELNYQADQSKQPSWSTTAGCFRVTASPSLLLRTSASGTVKTSNPFGTLLWVDKTPPSHVPFEFVEVRDLQRHSVYDPNYSGWSSKLYLEAVSLPYDECKGSKT